MDFTKELTELLTNLERLYIPEEISGKHLTLWNRVAYLWQNTDSRLMPFQMKQAYDQDLGLTNPVLELGTKGAADDVERLFASMAKRPPLSIEDTQKTNHTPKLIEDFTLTEGQEAAWNKLQHFLSNQKESRFFLLRGYSGTGKTFVLKKLLGLENQTIVLSAPTNKAAKVMTNMLGRKAKTIYSVLGIRMEQSGDELILEYPKSPPQGIRGLTIVIDECSMIGRQLLTFLLKAAEELDLKIIFVGDPAQLRPIGEIRSPVWSVVKDPKFRALLTEVKRYDDQLLVLATAIRSAIKNKTYDIRLRDYADQKKVICLDDAKFERTIEKAGDKARVVAWRNRTVDYFNSMIRTNLGFKGPYCVGDSLLVASPVVVEEEIVATIDEELLVLEVSEYDYLYQPYSGQAAVISCLRLSCSLEDGAVTLTIPTTKGRAILDSVLSGMAADARSEKSSWGRKTKWGIFWTFKNKFHKVRYGFSLTCHRVQGSTLGDVFVDRQDVLANPDVREGYQALYVASTRASNRVFFN